MVNTCVITTIGLTGNDMGEGVPTNGATVTVACRAVVLTGNEPLIANKLASVGDWHFHFPYGTTILEQDLITYSGTKLQVKAVLGPPTYAYDLQVLAEEVT